MSVTAAEVSPRKRMTRVMDAVAFGLIPPLSCEPCRESPGGKCADCRQSIDDIVAINEAITAVEDAEDDAAAERAFWDCMGALTGLTAEGGNW